MPDKGKGTAVVATLVGATITFCLIVVAVKHGLLGVIALLFFLGLIAYLTLHPYR